MQKQHVQFSTFGVQQPLENARLVRGVAEPETAVIGRRRDRSLQHYHLLTVRSSKYKNAGFLHRYRCSKIPRPLFKTFIPPPNPFDYSHLGGTLCPPTGPIMIASR